MPPASGGLPPGPPPAVAPAQPAAGPPPEKPGLWHQATSTTGGLIAVIVAACLVALLLLGVAATGVFVAAHVVANHREQRIAQQGTKVVIPPGQRKLQRGLPGLGNGQGVPGLGANGNLRGLLRGAGGLGAVQHGEFTVQGSNGTATVMTMQTGTVTKVSSTSLTVKSADNFTATYTLDSSTMGRTTGLANGTTVLVIAQKSGGKAVLVRVVRTS
jgi:hypothetical protein